MPMPQSFSRIDSVNKTTEGAQRSENFVMLFVTKNLPFFVAVFTVGWLG